MATPYQASDGGYGYSDRQIEENRYRVSFSGNPSTPRETVQNYLLYRAAELTVQSGYDYFTVVNQDTERASRVYRRSYGDAFGYNNRVGYRQGVRRLYYPRYDSANSYSISEYSTLADVVMANGEKPADDANAYDALDVLQNLQTLVREGGTGEVQDDQGGETVKKKK